MNYYVYIVLLIGSLVSCSESSRHFPRYEDFPDEKALNAQVIHLDPALFRYPFRVHVQGDKVVVMDLHATEYFFHAFRYPDFQYLTSFGKRGDAPEEILSAENFRWNGQFLWMLDAGKSKLTRLSFTLSGDSLLRTEVVSLDKEILRALDFVQYDDSIFIIPDYSGDSRFCKVSKSGKLMYKFGVIPTVDEDALRNVRPALAQAWRSFIDYNSRNGILAVATQLGEVLEIYNLKDSTHVVCMGPHGEPEFQVSGGYGIPTGIMGFSDVQVTDRAIYAVFHGRLFKDIARDARNGINHPDGGQFIYVFSLAGKPLKKYVLDHYICGMNSVELFMLRM